MPDPAFDVVAVSLNRDGAVQYVLSHYHPTYNERLRASSDGYLRRVGIATYFVTVEEIRSTEDSRFPKPVMLLAMAQWRRPMVSNYNSAVLLQNDHDLGWLGLVKTPAGTITLMDKGDYEALLVMLKLAEV